MDITKPTGRSAARSPPPKALADFEHINRYWDPVNEVYVAKLLPGEYYVTVAGEMVTTVLGSCIAACIRDRVLGIGGMNHFMLPSNAENPDRVWGGGSWVSAATRYGNHAMERLINGILKLGGRRENLEVKLFGGGRMLSMKANIGGRNAEFAKTYLRKENLALLAADVGGPYPRKVYYYPRTGKVRLKKLRTLHNDTISRREAQYGRHLENKPSKARVELF